MASYVLRSVARSAVRDAGAAGAEGGVKDLTAASWADLSCRWEKKNVEQKKKGGKKRRRRTDSLGGLVSLELLDVEILDEVCFGKEGKRGVRG